MKGNLKYVLSTFVLFLCFSTSVFALEVKIIPTDPVNGVSVSQNQTGALVSRRDMFELGIDLGDSTIKDSYQYINLYYKDVSKSSSDYKILQKIVYLGLLDNKVSKVYLDKPVTAYYFYTFFEKLLGEKIVSENVKITKVLQSRYANQYDIEKIEKFVGIGIEDASEGTEILEKKEIFNDVYNTLLDNHYDKETIDEKKMIYSAIKGLAEGTGDKHTVYFPPLENKSFADSLSGEFEGIGAYVDMKEPGVIYIITPIADGPASKAGLKAGDIIVKVGANEVGENTSLTEAISWIKGPAGTSVNLVIKRGTQMIDFSVKREKIIIKDIESELKDGNTLYIKMKNFGVHASEDLEETLGKYADNKNIVKIIFDLRNNPGGYLNIVNDILSNFVPKGQAVSVIKYQDYTVTNKSSGMALLDLSKYKLVVLQNGGTASASEIMIGTLKDYFPDMKIVGEKSYGKGSVQTIKSYLDGSSLKYTVAHWFTGKTVTGIDGVGIMPDVEVKFDDEKFKNSNIDTQLQKALNL